MGYSIFNSKLVHLYCNLISSEQNMYQFLHCLVLTFLFHLEYLQHNAQWWVYSWKGQMVVSILLAWIRILFLEDIPLLSQQHLTFSPCHANAVDSICMCVGITSLLCDQFCNSIWIEVCLHSLSYSEKCSRSTFIMEESTRLVKQHNMG
jgi:hypothetical protein